MRTLQFLALAALAFGVAGAPVAPAQPPENAKPDAKPAPHPDRFGFGPAFASELKKLGQLSPAEFAARYPAPQYRPKLSFDPTAAKFFAELNVEKVLKRGGKVKDEDGREYNVPDREIPGYKLTADELAAFKRNGFVVSERLGGTSFAQVYYDIYQRDLPVFVTTDSVLHAWHRSYDAMLEELELTYLRHALDGLLSAMHDALPKARDEYGAGVLKDSVRDADLFLTVALHLLHERAAPGKEDEQPRAPVKGRGKGQDDEPAPTPITPLPARKVASQLGQDDRIAKTLAAIKAEGMHEFELFGRVRNMDFSQFKPRGHYTTSHALRTYFKAMMWCGRTDLRIAGGYDKSGPLSSPRELGASMVLLDLLKRSGQDETWRQFDRCLQTFVGRTDSATFDDLALVAATAGVKSPADLTTAADLEKLTAAVVKLGAGTQDIRGDVYITPAPNVKVVLPQSFTVLGQKFVIDSWVMSKTVYDDISWKGELVQRRVPGGLDVAFAALGNNHVTPNLTARIQTGEHKWRDQKPYQHNLAAVRDVVDRLGERDWNDNLYTQWLKALRTLSAPAGDALPEVMQTREWALKQTNTQMASWTQLRHDTILYAKQSYTVGLTCYYPTGFVEPVLPFWKQMDAMATRAAELLAATPFPDAVKPTQAKQVAFLRAFAARMKTLSMIVEKQLAQQELSADDKTVLADVMQITQVPMGCYSVPRYDGWYPALFYRGRKDSARWDALVADVHTDVPALPIGDPGCVLHQGVGNIDLMIIAVDNGKDRVVYVGPTLSHYEFETPNAVRRTDDEWKEQLLKGTFPPRPDYTRGYLVPAADRKGLAEKMQRDLNREKYGGE